MDRGLSIEATLYLAGSGASVFARTAECSIALQVPPPDVRAHGDFIGSHVGGWMAACLPATRFGRMLSARRHAAVLCQAVACRVRGR